jgi:hypothetical protein
LLPDQLKLLDQWSSRQSDCSSRPEAIRRLIELGLSAPAAKIPRIIASGDAAVAAKAKRAAISYNDVLERAEAPQSPARPRRKPRKPA